MNATPPPARPGAHLRSSEPRRITLAEMLCLLGDPILYEKIEKYRLEYEAVHGETDLTKHYTSMFPLEYQKWLTQHEPRRYFDGLPPFFKAYLKGKMQIAAKDGGLDDMPDSMLRLFLKGEMRLDSEKDRGRS